MIRFMCSELHTFLGEFLIVPRFVCIVEATISFNRVFLLLIELATWFQKGFQHLQIESRWQVILKDGGDKRERSLRCSSGSLPDCFIFRLQSKTLKLTRLLTKGLPGPSIVPKGVKAGFKAASIACVASAVPTLTAVRTIPWFKANLNYTGQALVISAATIATYFIVTDHTIHECSRQGSYDALVKRRSGAP